MDSTGYNGMVARIEKRMRERGLNRTALDKEAGLVTGFTRDLLTGRKAQPRIGNLERLAAALDCPLHYLLNGDSGASDHAPAKSTITEVMLVGYCEFDAWHGKGKPVEPTKSGCFPDPRFAPEHQEAYEVRDGHAESHGVSQGETVIVLSAAGMASIGITPGYGDLVVSTRDEGQRSETTLLLLSGPHESIRIDGLVLSAVRKFRTSS